jgi:hypothetical protein
MSSDLQTINKGIIEQVANEVRLTEEFDTKTKSKTAKSKSKK